MRARRLRWTWHYSGYHSGVAGRGSNPPGDSPSPKHL